MTDDRTPDSAPQPPAGPPSLVERARVQIRERGLGRFLKFAVVGASGVVVNMGVFVAAFDFFFVGLGDESRLMWAGVLAVGVSILTNFLLNDAWTWGDREKGGALHFAWRLAKYFTVASIAGVVQLVVLWLLVRAGLDEHVSNLAGIVAGIGINYVANNWWTFRAGADDTPPEVDASPSSVEPTV